MKRITYPFAIGLVLLSAFTVQAQIDTIVRAFVDQAARNSQRQPQPQRRQQQSQRNSPRQPKKLFDGTWLATQSKANPESEQTINRTFTLIIKDGKATKTLDATNISTAQKPFYSSTAELQRRWTYTSIECLEQGTTLTIQWSPGQLADWSPKTIPNSIVEGFGSPGPETSVYKLEGDQLTRINDPNGLVYRKAK